MVGPTEPSAPPFDGQDAPTDQGTETPAEAPAVYADVVRQVVQGGDDVRPVPPLSSGQGVAHQGHSRPHAGPRHA